MYNNSKDVIKYFAVTYTMYMNLITTHLLKLAYYLNAFKRHGTDFVIRSIVYFTWQNRIIKQWY